MRSRFVALYMWGEAKAIPKRVLVGWVGVFFGLQLCNGIYNRFLPGPAFWLVDVLLFAALPIVLVIHWRRSYLHALRDLGLAPGPDSLALTLSSLIAASLLISFVSLWCYGVAVGRLRPHFGDVRWIQGFDYKSAIPTGVAGMLAILYLAASAGFMEELVYRGMLRELTRGWVLENELFVVLSSTLFAIMHWEGGLAAVLVGFVMGGLFSSMFLLVRGNLWPVMFAHALVDFVVFVAP